MKDLKKAQEFLQRQHSTVISTLSPEGKPQAAFVFYGLDEDNNLFFITKNGTRKAQNLEKNSNVALVVTDEVNMRTLQMEGTAALVKDSKTNIDLMNRWLERNVTLKENWPPPLFSLDKGQLLIFKVNITWLNFSDFDWIKTVK